MCILVVTDILSFVFCFLFVDISRFRGSCSRVCLFNNIEQVVELQQEKELEDNKLVEKCKKPIGIGEVETVPC